MSVHVSSWVWRQSKASGNDLLVLLSLADQANDDGTCWPSIANIAKRCRCSERTAQRGIKNLVNLNELVVTGRFRENGQQDSALYRIRGFGGVNLSPGGDSRVTGGVTSTTSPIIKETSLETSVVENTSHKAKPSCIEEVVSLATRLGLPVSDGEWAWLHWQSNGFTNGGRPIKDWKQCINAWKVAGYMPSQKNSEKTKPRNILGGGCTEGIRL